MKPAVPLHQHPTVVALGRRARPEPATGARPLDAARIKELCLACGADDCGLVSIDHPDLADQRAELLLALPGTRTLISFVVRMGRDAIRSPLRSIANNEFHHTNDQTDEVGRALALRLEREGLRALHPSVGFPMEMERFPGKVWVVSHKPVAQAAGLGRIGLHRNLIHPRFGNFILLGTVLLAAEVSAHDPALDYNPCLGCKLCVAACPVGAVHENGRFDFLACATHNYREFLGGFVDWTDQVVASRSPAEYRARVEPSETASLWQSLSFGANYKAAYCLAACPAGEEVIGPFLDDRGAFVEQVVRPLQRKEEPVYVVEGSDAEAHVRKRFPHKRVRRVRSGLKLGSVRGLLGALPRVFQPGQAGELRARYHFTFTGSERLEATVVIDAGTVQIEPGLVGTADLAITADSATWLGFVAGEKGLLRALVTRAIRLRGPPGLLRAFGRCFRS